MTTLRAILFARDGTLVTDAADTGDIADPTAVRVVPGALDALDAARAHKIHLGVVTNQPGSLLTEASIHAVNAQVDRLLGPFDTWQVCPHGPGDGCECRKPKPGMVLAACQELGVRPEETVLIGDTGADVEAAQAAGAHSILVPTSSTSREEIDAAPRVEPTLTAAVHQVLGVPVR